MKHDDESGNELHTAEHFKSAGMLKASGRLIPSDIKGKTGMVLQNTAAMGNGRKARLNSPNTL